MKRQTVTIRGCTDAYLLQKGSQLAGAPLVRFGQIQVAEKEDDAVAFLRPEDTTRVAARAATGNGDTALHQFVKHVAWASLRGTLHHGYLRNAFAGCQTILQQEAVKKQTYNKPHEIDEAHRHVFILQPMPIDNIPVHLQGLTISHTL